MAAGAAGMVLGRPLEPWDFGSTADIFKTIPQDLLAELKVACQFSGSGAESHEPALYSRRLQCGQIIQYLQCQIPGVNTVELCQRFQAAGIEIIASDLAKVVNVVSSVFSTAAKDNLSTEELSMRLGSAVGTLPKQALQVIRHVWNEQGKSITGSEDAKSRGMVGQLIDFQWKLGVAVGSDSCRSLKCPYVTMAIKVADASGHVTSKSFEMTVPQFQNFYSQFKEMASVLETV